MNKEDKIELPDYSHVERKQVPGEFKWKVEDIYPGMEEWQKEKTLLLEKIGGIDELAKDWTADPGRMFELLNHVDETEKIEDRLYLYTSLLADTDMGNSQYQALKGEILAIDVDFSSKLSFIDPDILKLGKKKIGEYIEADPRLDVYTFKFDSVLRMKAHILPTDQEKIIAQTGLFSGGPGKASGFLNNLDMPFPRLTLSDGKKIRLNIAAYSRYRDVENREDRRKVMRTYWKHHTGFKNTHAALLDAEIKKHLFKSRVRNYKNCLEAALYPNNIDPDVYHTLIQTVKENLGAFHRYLELKTRLLGLDKLGYEDIYASSVPKVEKLYPVEEAKKILLEALKPLGKNYTGVLQKGLDGGWM
ncbi:MAG: oligoendopeptidase F family protein, partial [bacterium]|nr:oligoendopeptidase F family protein [bacterium]